MIKKLYPNLKDNVLVCEKYKIDILLNFESVSVSVDMYVDHDSAVELLNNFNAGELKSYMNLSKYPSHYYVEYGNYEIKNIKLESYYDCYGRECTVNIDKKYDFNKRTLIYSSIGKNVFDCEYSSSVWCDFFEYSKPEDVKNYIEFKINIEDIDRYFFLYIYNNYQIENNKKETITLRIDKETLELTCVEKPELLIGMKVKNI